MAKLKDITVNIGLSIDMKGTWVKAGTGVRIELDEEDSANASLIFERAFELASSELDEQLKRLDVKGIPGKE